ncbi:MAG: glycoside hydrolase family 32 protein, partial [Verrucomicrobiae bacterium]|nr:glycoside hydrolase family 32 protein [Verrucomicrobiae bacterium]
PFGDKWGHMSWGHAVSRDLLTWEHLPVAIPEKDGVMAFSGSAVVDHRNTSGFGSDGKPPMVAIYTGHREGRQDQRLAYSTDKGRTWTMYEGNPVLDENMADFRDPKVFWHEPSRKWIMVVALAVERRVAFYQSPDLKKWSLLSRFGPAGAVKGIWECPDLFELPVEGTDRKRWVLHIN